MMDNRQRRRTDDPDWWMRLADKACLYIIRTAFILLALLLTAQAALADDGVRHHLSPTERLEGTPYGGR